MDRMILKSKKNTHYAEAVINGKDIIVLKGSKINPLDAFPKMSNELKIMRGDRTIVSEEGILLKDMTFNSPSTAAQFVTGRSVNGYIAWRPNDEMSLKAYLEMKK